MYSNAQAVVAPLWPAFLSAAEDLTPEETSALHQYQGVDYSVINMALRSPQFFSRDFNFRRWIEVGDMIRHLDAALSKCQLNQQMVVYHGLNMNMDLASARRLSGTIFCDPGFVSTSTDINKALRFCPPASPLMRIILPAGTPAICLDALEDMDESELLLMRNGRFRILSAGEQDLWPEKNQRQIVLSLQLLS